MGVALAPLSKKQKETFADQIWTELQEKCTGSGQTFTQAIREILNANSGSVLVAAKRASPDRANEKTPGGTSGSAGDGKKPMFKSRRPCFNWRDNGKCAKHNSGECPFTHKAKDKGKGRGKAGTPESPSDAHSSEDDDDKEERKHKNKKKKK